VEREAHKALAGIEEREFFMDSLRRFKQQKESERLRLHESGDMSLENMLFSLTAVAQVCLQEAYLFENSALKRIHGVPNSHYHMVAMGKFGGCEMTVKSDLDMIFIFAEHAETSGPKVITNQEYFSKLSQRVISNLSLLTGSGRLYEVDTQLRPSGRSGILVSSWNSFKDYHAKDARTWEKQALLRARPIEPDPAVYWKVDEQLVAQIWNQDYGSDVAEKIHDLRLKMERELAKEGSDYYNIKVGQGGIIDIEFVVQYLQLRYGGEKKSIRAPHTLTGLRALAAEGLIDELTANQLETAYIFYRKIETCLRQLELRESGLFPRREGEELESLAHAMKQDVHSLLESYETFRRDIRQRYLGILGV
jgi:glutamate-ammonia-ligase adenylyltransferase